MLDKNLFTDQKREEPIRSGFGAGLLELAQKDDRVVALCADLTESTKVDAFKKAFANRFIEMGIAEQSMASVASGMAAMGKIPFIVSYAMFNPGRNWEQIRTTICYNNVPVKVVGAHAGVSVGPDGGTHQAIEDIAIMRVIPRMTVIVPTDSVEAKKAVLAMGKMDTPGYIRLAREKSAIVTAEDAPFEIGKVYELYQERGGDGVGIIACGQMVYEALVAAKKAEEEGYAVGVLSMPTIKPLDSEGLLRFAKRFKKIITVEEHQIAGGMGSAVAEYLSEVNAMPVIRMGIKDQFGQSGTPTELLEHYGLTSNHILKTIKEHYGNN